MDLVRNQSNSVPTTNKKIHARDWLWREANQVVLLIIVVHQATLKLLGCGGESIRLCPCEFAQCFSGLPDLYVFSIGLKFKLHGTKCRNLVHNEYINVAGTSFIAFHFTTMTKTNKFNDGEFQQLVVLSVGT